MSCYVDVNMGDLLPQDGFLLEADGSKLYDENDIQNKNEEKDQNQEKG